MKRIFTIDDIMIAFVTSLVYGFGETVSNLLGWPFIVSLGVNFVVGSAFEGAINKLAFSAAIQRRPRRRTLLYATFILVFLLAQIISVTCVGVSMVDSLVSQVISVIGFAILGFVVTMASRAFRASRVRRRYGKGEAGYVFDLKKEDIEEANQRNRPIEGSYDADCAVRTRTGVYVGERQHDSVAFLGIPYAKPPVGELRWKAPEPLDASDAVFEAKNFGASAVQIEHKGSIVRNHRQSEDCLTLNIGVGTDESEALRPVIVLIHHGDFTYEGIVDPLLYGDEFVKAHPDTVFVSFNYRLGVFGFIDFSEVPGGEAYPDAPNLGLLDQIAALRWIRENIAAFGGDPERITVLGMESGAISILLLAASERAKGLFQRVFVFCGSELDAYGTPEPSRALAKNLLAATGTKTMDELMRLDTQTLKEAAQNLWPNMCAPTCDGAVVPLDIQRAYREGAAAGIDFVLGIPSNEREVIRSFIGERNFEVFVSLAMDDLKGEITAPVARAVDEYLEREAATSSELDAKSRLIEQWSALCMYRSAMGLAACGCEVHLLYWDQKPLIDGLGSGTVDVAAALLGNDEASELYGNVLNDDLSEILQSLLAKFASGRPLELYPNEIKGVDAFEWKAFPHALVVADDTLRCETIEDRLCEVDELVEHVTS